MQQYKRQCDKNNCHQNNFTVGQEVRLKCNDGHNDWINYKRHYYIERKINLGNFSVKGPKGCCQKFYQNLKTSNYEFA